MTNESAAPRVVPVIKPANVHLEWAGMRRKSLTIFAPEGLTPQDLQDHSGTVWKLVQGMRDPLRTLAADDEVLILAADRSWTIVARVDYADGTTVVLYDIRKPHRQGRDVVAWRLDGYEGRFDADGYSYYRSSDGVRMSTATWPTAEAARSACLREMFPARVA
jgi:hypothetical protein